MKKLFIGIALLLFASLGAVARSAPDTIIKVQWRQISGDPVTIDSAGRPKTKAHGFTKPGVYQFEFKVFSSNGMSDADTMKVTVIDGVLSIVSTDLSYTTTYNQEVIKWVVQGDNIQQLYLQKSYDGSHFNDLVSIPMIGSKTYPREIKSTWFRIRGVSDNVQTLSKIIFIKGLKDKLIVYQSGKNAIVISDKSGQYVLNNQAGQILKKGFINSGTTTINLSQYTGSVILSIKTSDGVTTFKTVL